MGTLVTFFTSEFCFCVGAQVERWAGDEGGVFRANTSLFFETPTNMRLHGRLVTPFEAARLFGVDAALRSEADSSDCNLLFSVVWPDNEVGDAVSAVLEKEKSMKSRRHFRADEAKIKFKIDVGIRVYPVHFSVVDMLVCDGLKRFVIITTISSLFCTLTGSISN